MRILSLFVLFLFTATLCFAHPPSEIKLSYDAEEGVLLVDVTHITRDMKEHFIRRITVQVNDQEPYNYYYKKQKSAKEFSAKIPLVAYPDEEVKVIIYSEKGGSQEESLTIQRANQDSRGESQGLRRVEDLSDYYRKRDQMMKESGY